SSSDLLFGLVKSLCLLLASSFLDRALPSFPTPTLFRSYAGLEHLQEEESKVFNYLLQEGDVLLPARGTAIRTAVFHEQSHPCIRSEEHTSELQLRFDLVCRLLFEKKNTVYEMWSSGNSL